MDSRRAAAILRPVLVESSGNLGGGGNVLVGSCGNLWGSCGCLWGFVGFLWVSCGALAEMCGPTNWSILCGGNWPTNWSTSDFTRENHWLTNFLSTPKLVNFGRRNSHNNPTRAQQEPARIPQGPNKNPQEPNENRQGPREGTIFLARNLRTSPAQPASPASTDKFPQTLADFYIDPLCLGRVWALCCAGHSASGEMVAHAITRSTTVSRPLTTTLSLTVPYLVVGVWCTCSRCARLHFARHLCRNNRVNQGFAGAVPSICFLFFRERDIAVKQSGAQRGEGSGALRFGARLAGAKLFTTNCHRCGVSNSPRVLVIALFPPLFFMSTRRMSVNASLVARGKVPPQPLLAHSGPPSVHRQGAPLGSMPPRSSVGSSAATGALGAPSCGERGCAESGCTRHCRFCKRSERAHNPTMKKHQGPFLAFVSAKSKQCLNCRAFLRTCVHGCSIDEFSKELESDPERQKSYLESLSEYEALYNDTTGYLKNPASKITMPSWVTAILEQGTEAIMNVGIFWPKAIYDKHEKEPLPKDQCVPYTYCGKKLLGIWRDKVHGEPMGTIAQNKVMTKKTQHATEVANSKNEFRKGGLADAYKAASTMATGFDAVLSAGGDGKVESLTFKDKGAASVEKKKILAKRLSDSSEDWASALLPGVKVGGGGKRSQDKHDMEESDDSDNSEEDDGPKRKHKLKRKNKSKKAKATVASDASVKKRKIQEGHTGNDEGSNASGPTSATSGANAPHATA